MPDKVEDGFIRVEDKIYSADKLANFHPGGPLFVKVRLRLTMAPSGLPGIIEPSLELFFWCYTTST